MKLNPLGGDVPQKNLPHIIGMVGIPIPALSSQVQNLPAVISEPFHPQVKIFNINKLIGRIAIYRRRGETVRADELKNAVERALKIKVEIELFNGGAA